MVFTYDEINIWEDVFCLHELPGMAKMEHVVNAIGINTHRTPRCPYFEKYKVPRKLMTTGI